MLVLLILHAGYTTCENAQKGDGKMASWMQTDESRQEVATAIKVNLATAKTTLAAMKTTLATAIEKLTAAVNPRIKWREEKAKLAHYSENLFSLQRKYAVLTLLEHETLDKKRVAGTICGDLRKDG